MQPQRHFSADPDIRIDIAKLGAILALVMGVGIVVNVIAAARFAVS